MTKVNNFASGPPPPATPGGTSGGGTPGGPAGGDLGGPGFPGPTVIGLQGTPICVTSPTLNDVLTFDGTEWCPAAITGGGLPSGSAGQMLSLESDGVTPLWVDDRINVLDWGAVGNDTADDTTTIQAAINAVPAIGGTVYFPPGHTYKITGTLTCAVAGTVLLGGGNRLTGSIIKQHTANTTAISFGTQYKEGMVRGLYVLGPYGNSSGRGIYALADVQVQETRVEGFHDGIYIDHLAFYSRVQNCWVNGNSNVQVWLNGTNNTTIDACTINGQTNAGSFVGAYGVVIIGSLNSRVTNCAIEGFSNYGVEVEGGGPTNSYSQATLISACYMESNTNGDIVVGPTAFCYGTTIEDCYLNGHSGTFASIDLYKAIAVTIKGGTIGFGVTITGHAINSTSDTADVVIVNCFVQTGAVALPTNSRWVDPETYVVPQSVANANLAGVGPYFAMAAHVHALGGTVGGDLSGTAPNPTVAKINGVAVTGTPAVGFVPTATSGSTATWQAQAGGSSTHTEVVMSSGALTPPDPVLSSDGLDWVYGVFP